MRAYDFDAHKTGEKTAKGPVHLMVSNPETVARAAPDGYTAILGTIAGALIGSAILLFPIGTILGAFALAAIEFHSIDLPDEIDDDEIAKRGLVALGRIGLLVLRMERHGGGGKQQQAGGIDAVGPANQQVGRGGCDQNHQAEPQQHAARLRQCKQGYITTGGRIPHHQPEPAQQQGDQQQAPMHSTGALQESIAERMKKHAASVA